MTSVSILVDLLRVSLSIPLCGCWHR